MEQQKARLAEQLARELNLPTNNSLLATTLISQIRLHAPKDNFNAFVKAARTFGNFREEFLQEVWSEWKGSVEGMSAMVDVEALGSSGVGPSGGLVGEADKDGKPGEYKVPEMVITDSDVLMPAPAMPGGLVMPGANRHVFKPSANGNGVSDTAAKRQKAVREEMDRERKRIKLDFAVDDQDGNQDAAEPEFKGEQCRSPALIWSGQGMYLIRYATYFQFPLVVQNRSTSARGRMKRLLIQEVYPRPPKRSWRNIEGTGPWPLKVLEVDFFFFRLRM